MPRPLPPAPALTHPTRPCRIPTNSGCLTLCSPLRNLVSSVDCPLPVDRKRLWMQGKFQRTEADGLPLALERDTGAP